jgi:hypothetical protein
MLAPDQRAHPQAADLNCFAHAGLARAFALL